MADRNVWRGLNDADKVAVLLEVLLAAATPSAGTPFSATVNTALDTLTEAQAKALLATFGARQNRAQYGT